MHYVAACGEFRRVPSQSYRWAMMLVMAMMKCMKMTMCRMTMSRMMRMRMRAAGTWEG